MKIIVTESHNVGKFRVIIHNMIRLMPEHAELVIK